MRVIGVREAFGGPSSFNAVGWLVLFIPSTVLVLVQESATPFPHIGYVVLSAVMQHLVAGLISLPAATFARRSDGPLPIWLCYVLWTAIGLSRGVVGGFAASAFAQVDPDFPVRIMLWLLVGWVWMPLFSYSAAQVQHRRLLLRYLDDSVARRDTSRRLHDRSADEIREQLTLAVQTAVASTVDDIRASLDAARMSLDPDQFRLVGDRLAAVSRQVGSVVDRLSQTPDSEPHGPLSAGAPLRSAFTFEHRRPWLSSALSAAALVAVLGPLCVALEGWFFLGEFVLGMLVATLVLALGTRIVPRGLDRIRTQVAWVIIRYLVAGLSAALVMAIARWENLDSAATAFILMLPYGVAFLAFVVSGAVGVTAANGEAVRSIAEIEAERAEIETIAAREENSIRDQLSEVMHGPVLGRLAACAMALNFHSAEVGRVPAKRTDEVAAAVVEHLDAATADLRELLR